MAKRPDPEEIVKFYEDLRPGKEDTPEDKLRVTAKYFHLRPSTVKNHLRFWWPGKKYMREFQNEKRRGGKQKWEIQTQDLVKALNENETITKTAKALKTTPITLTKRIREKGIRQVWTART